jgi:hypothetical protein
MDHRPTNLRPPIRQLLVHHDHVHRPADPSDGVPQANGLGDAVLDFALDDQEVQIAVARELAARSRSKQDHTGRRPNGLHKPLTGWHYTALPSSRPWRSFVTRERACGVLDGSRRLLDAEALVGNELWTCPLTLLEMRYRALDSSDGFAITAKRLDALPTRP